MNPTMNNQGNLNTLREMLNLIKERDELQSQISDLSEKFRLLTVERNDLKTRNAELVTRKCGKRDVQEDVVMKWTKEMPQAEGLYWIRTALGDSGGTVHIVKGKEGFMCAEYPKRDAKDTGTWRSSVRILRKLCVVTVKSF